MAASSVALVLITGSGALATSTTQDTKLAERLVEGAIAKQMNRRR